MKHDSWNPKQYEKFKDQRSQPFYDLLSLLEPVQNARVVDLGCGTGALTSELHEKVGAKETLGIDSSESMLASARVHQAANLRFEKIESEKWRAENPVQILFSNAALQWCDGHRELFANLAKQIVTGGQLAVQMPMNHDYATHILAKQMSRESHWSKLLGGESRDQDKIMLSAEEYAGLLYKLGFKNQKVILRVYGHELESRAGVIEWVQGTLLTYYKSCLQPEDYQNFTAEFQERLFQILPDERPFFYPFKRILIWGKKS